MEYNIESSPSGCDPPPAYSFSEAPQTSPPAYSTSCGQRLDSAGMTASGSLPHQAGADFLPRAEWNTEKGKRGGASYQGEEGAKRDEGRHREPRPPPRLFTRWWLQGRQGTADALREEVRNLQGQNQLLEREKAVLEAEKGALERERDRAEANAREDLEKFHQRLVELAREAGSCSWESSQLSKQLKEREEEIRVLRLRLRRRASF
ncbi:predicted protein [Uncinocarpus reesii 1704]|uniref:Uncharacterized protein n=1 Tax=Uncinocarpus reesii (strain UAMH 1704) TaxID=336963 RepID=C4JXN4_UNCRE|nr:uncharacterized protein UREG_06407 [Uncinocarpus reesii 1704]EEP81542.1 predicted protein [Uncinocarpus reesii 1704]